MIFREQLEQREFQELAPYALKSAQSRGRRYPEPQHPYRTEFQRDRDRIVHSTAFRRLQHKTQVFVTHEGDHYRTRLTHTLEVALISRSIARALRLNEDFSEALALAHDLGHTPFGHTGEEVLNRILKDQGGFEHNRQCLRVVDHIESRYPDFPGLNLTYELREGILKHHSNLSYPGIPDDLTNGFGPSLESQIVNIADEIAYNCHDVDDGLASGLIENDQLAELEIWKLAAGSQAPETLSDPGTRRHALVRYLINFLVTDLLRTSSSALGEFEETKVELKAIFHSYPIRFSEPTRHLNNELKQFLGIKLYKNPKLLKAAAKASEMLEVLFAWYSRYPDQLPDHFRARLEDNMPALIVTDYIAGMTDRFAIAEYQRAGMSAKTRKTV